MQLVLVAAGRGERLGTPKALLPLGGRPLFTWALAAYRRAGVGRAVVVARPEDVAAVSALAPAGVRVVAGGNTRTESVARGFEALGVVGPDDVVHVHDAARPFASPALIRRVEAAVEDAAVPVLPVDDTLAWRRPTDLGVPDRSELVRVQTPQAFRAPVLRAVLAAGAEATDEAQVARRLGFRVAHVAGAPENFKITWPEDLTMAEVWLAGRLGAPRVGQGFDAHRFAPGRPLVLAGVPIPAEESGGLGLEGHSDADVVLHAIMDACLGAAGLDDIGVHFPPGDPRFAGADSTRLLRRVLDLVADAGLRPVAVDVTVIAERPRLGPHRAAMRRRLAELLGIPTERVGLKATTSEGMGALGRGEGMACLALATLVADV